MAIHATKFSFGDFHLDAANAQLLRGKIPVALAPKPFDLLCYLVDRAGDLVTKEELLDRVWRDVHVSESSLSFSINALRAALKDDAQSPRYIETVRRRGYRFIAPITLTSLPLLKSLTEVNLTSSDRPTSANSRCRVGRHGPLDAFDTALQKAITGRRQALFVTGEAGIGKTTFVEMAIERIASRGICILRGYCVELLGSDEAFLPLIEALQDLCRDVDGQETLKMVRQHAPTWLAQMPAFFDSQDHAAVRNEVFGATRERMLREFCDLVEAIGVDQPLIIILEDLHWSDLGTIDFLSRFARRDRRAAVLILATYRSVDMSDRRYPIRALSHDLQMHGQGDEIALDLMSESDIAQYLFLRFPTFDVVKMVAERVFKRTRGLPLFVVAMIDYCVKQGTILEDGGCYRWASDGADHLDEIPRNLRDMITLQISQLGADQQALLKHASAAGTEFSSSMAAAILGRDVVDVEQACEVLARDGGLLFATGVVEWPDGTVSGRYTFRHALDCEVLYQQLGPAERVKAHQRLALRLEIAYGDEASDIAPALALHFEQGHVFGKAISHLGLAAEKAAARFSNREAETYLSRALSLVERLPTEERLQIKVKVLQQRGWIRRANGNFPGSVEDLNAMIADAAATGQVLSEASGLLDLSRFYLYADRPRCLPTAQRALDKGRDLDNEIFRALVYGNSANLSLMLKGWSDDDVRICLQAVQLLSNVREPTLIMRRCSLTSVIDYMSSNFIDCAAAAHRGRDMARTIGDMYLFVLYSILEAFALIHIGQWKKLQEIVEATLSVTDRNANRPAGSLCRLAIAWLHAEALDFAGARDLCHEELDPTADRDPFHFFISRNLLVKAALGHQDYLTAQQHLEAMRHRIESEGVDMESFIRPHYHHSYSLYSLAIGDFKEAREQAQCLYNMSVKAPDRNNLALSFRLQAEIAMASEALINARDKILSAVEALEDTNLLPSKRRVYETASNYYERVGEPEKATEFRIKGLEVANTLAENLGKGDILQSTLLEGHHSQVLV